MVLLRQRSAPVVRWRAPSQPSGTESMPEVNAPISTMGPAYFKTMSLPV